MAVTELVVFDMSGTTVEDHGNVATCFLQAFNSHGIDVPEHELTKVRGFRKRDAITILLKAFHPENGSEELGNEIHCSFTNRMIEYYQSTTELRAFPNAEKVFHQLKSSGISVALNTGFTRPITQAILSKLQWNANLIDSVICSDEVENGRPDPAMIFELMRRLEITSAQQVMKVGDTAVDIAEGRNAGCGKVIAITTGAYNRKQLEVCLPDRIVDDLNEILEFV